MKRNPLRTWLPYAFAAIVAPLIAAWPQRAEAANLYWDGTDTTVDADGGAGTWTTANAWDTVATGGTNATWSSVTPDAATFGGVAGTVTVSAATTVAGITFTTTGYTIAGAGPLTLSTSTIGTGANDATISAILAGTTAVTKTGTGVLTLSGANTTTGAFAINGGTVKLGNVLALGTTAGGATVAAGAVLDLNGIAVGAEALTLNGTGIGSNGALINSSATAASTSGTVAMASASSVGGTGAVTLSGIVSGAFALTKVGANTLTLSGANTYTGVTTISAGTVVAQNNAALGTTAGATTIAAGASLNLGGNLAANGLNLGTEAISVSGTGVGGLGAITNTGTNGQQNAIQGAVTMTGATTFGGTQRWDIRNGTLNGGGFNLTKVGTNSVFISGTGSMSNLGNLIVRQGEFVVETGVRATSANTTGILLQPTTAVQAAFRSWGNNVDHSANIAMDSTFAGSSTRLEVQNGVTTHSGTITATGGDNRLDVDSNQTMIVSGVLAGAGTLSKEDTGLLLVNHALNTHSGAFTVNGGVLGGSGTLNSSSVTLNNGTTLSPGNSSGGAGTLTMGATTPLVSNGTNTGLFNLGTSSDLVNTTTLTQNGTTNIAVAYGAGIAAATPYTLYNYTTLNGTNSAGFVVAGTHLDGTVTDTGSSIQLTLNSVAPLTWNGASNGQWNTGTLNNPALSNFNWAQAPGGRVESVTNDNILFDDTNTGATGIVVNGSVTPASMVFNHSALNYTVDVGAPGQSAGGINGTSALVKNGSGTLTLLGAVNFTGPVTVNGGTLQLGNDSRVGTLTGGNTGGNNLAGTGPTIALAPGSTLGIAVGNSVDTVYGNNISGSGSIVLNATEQDTYFNYKADRGAVRLGGDNAAFTGSITVNDGNRLRLDSLTAVGGSSGVTIKNGGGLLTNVANFTSAVPFTVEGKGWSETTGQLGAIRLFSNAVLSGPVTMTGDTRITAYNSSGTLSGVISGNAALEFGFNHTSTSSGTLNGLNAANTYTGDTTVTRMTLNAATLANAGSNSSFGTGSKLITDNAALTFSSPANMVSDRTFVAGGLGIGATSIGVTTPGVSLTLNGAITNTPQAGSNTVFPQGLNFLQTAVAGAGGTVVLDLAQPVISGGTTVHRQNLTLLNNTQLTVAPSSVGVGGAFNVGNSTGTDVGNATLTIQDNARLTVFGEFDIGNQGVANTYTVNQSGNTIVTALRGGGTTSADSDILHRGMRIGHWGAESSVYNLSGGTLNVPHGHLWVGYDGGGTMNQGAGTTVNAAGLRMVRSATLPAVYNLDGGTLNVGAYGFAKGVAATVTVPQFNFNGGTYRATADHAISSGIAINFLAGGGTIDTNGFNVTSASGMLVGNGGALTKIGVGELILPTANSISGGINVNGGALSGVAGATITASTVTVNNGGTLGGGFVVSSAGGTVVNSGGIISPGANSGAAGGTFATSLLALSSGSQLNLTPTSDLINVTTANGLSGSTNINVLPVGTLAAGPIDLLTYAGISTLAFTSSLPHLIAASVTDTGAGQIQLNHGGQETLTWTGGTNGLWNTTPANANFNASTSGAVAFLEGDISVFDSSTAPANTAITIAAGGVTPASVVINDTTSAFAFTGGAITGGTSLVKNGAGTTVMAANNTYHGGTTVNDGTLQIGNGGTAGALGAGNTALTLASSTLAFNRSDASSYNGVISGAGSIRSDGSGTTTLGGTNTYTGGTVISTGTLQGNHNSFGNGTITLNDASTGANNTALLIQNGATAVIPNNIVVSNNGSGSSMIGSSEDSLVATGLAFSGTLTLNRPTTLVGEFDRTTFQGVVGGTATTLTIGRSTGLENAERGRVVLEQSHAFTGLTNVVIADDSVLQLTNITNSTNPNTVRDQLPDTATVSLGNNATLQTGASGSANDGETIGDLISTSVTSRLRSTGGTSADLTFGTANNTTFNGVVDGGTGTFRLIKQGTGTFTLGGTLDNGSGRLTVNAGTVVLAKDSSNTVHALGNNSTVSVGATLQLGGTYTVYRDESTNRDSPTQYQLNAPANFVDQIYNNVDMTVDGTLDMGGRSEVFDGLLGSGTVTNSVAGSVSTLYLGAAGSTDTFGGILQDGAGRLNFAKGGTGTMIFSGANTYTGTTDINAGTLTINHPGVFGSAATGTTIRSNRDQASAGTTTLNFNITTASTAAAPNLFAEPLTLISELSNDQRAGLAVAATNQSLRLTGGLVIEGDGINQINNGSTVAGNQLQINGGITGTSNGTLFLRGTGEIQVNSVVNVPNVIFAKTDTGLLIVNASGHDYREAQFVHGTVRTDLVNALDTGAIVRMGQGGNGNTLDLNGNNQTVAGILTNAGVTDNFARTITSVAPATLNVNTAAATGGDFGYGGTISGAVTLQKSGPGAQVLTASIAGNSLTYTGKTIVSGGTLRLAANDRIPDAAATSNVVVGDGATTAFLDLNGYNDTINGLHGTASGTVHSNGGHLGGVANSVLTLRGTATPALDATFSGTLKNNTDTGTSTLALIKSGTGTQILAGTNTYTGATTISAGTLLINGNNAGATGAISVASGATLGGSGSLGGALTVADGGIFAPGNSPGTLTTTTSASFGNSSVLSYEFNGGDTTVGGGVNDLFTGVINLTLDGVLNVNETVVGSFLSASLGDTWRLIDYSGTFTNNTLDLGATPALSGGNAFAVDTSVAGQVNLVVVPETSSAGLLGLTALLTLRRRRRAA